MIVNLRFNQILKKKKKNEKTTNPTHRRDYFDLPVLFGDE
jgi:hypothetical protein